MITKEQAIAEIVTLFKDNKINIHELTAALSVQDLKTNQKDASNLVRLFSYLGGIFILIGLGYYISLSWQELNSFSRILITLGPGIVSLIIAIASKIQYRRESHVTILVVLSAIFQVGGLFVAVKEFSTGIGDIRIVVLVIFGIVAIEYGAIFYKLKITALLFFTLYFSATAFISLCSLIGIPHNLVKFICGISLLAISYTIQKTQYNSICGFWYFISSILLLWLGFDLVNHTSYETSYIGIVSLMLYVSTIVRSRSILTTSTIALISYIAYFTKQHFLNSVGWPISLILLGFMLFGASHLAFKLNKKYIA